MKKIIGFCSAALLLALLFNNRTYGQAKINAYFNQPVNTSLATFGINAAYLPSATMADTIAAYILRAKHTVDIAQYDYNQDNYDGNYYSIASAVDTAYAHGITVRWIYDASASNHGLSLLDTGIHTLGRPVNSSGNIMHNKFIIIDANSGHPEDAVVSTGSEDWSSEMFYKDFNNILFIQDSALASVYTAEFNMMWGSTTAVPDSALAKFGTAKTPIGINTFNIAGHLVELYFSPSDNPDSHIASTILTANKDLYVGVYDMTRTGDATNIVNRAHSGVYTLAIVDPYTPTSSPSVNSILSSGLGSDYVVYNGFYLYHNKMMIVYPSDTCSDPLVLTGSENWTSAGTNYNDENILIIHNDTLANIYYQSFISNFTTFGGGYFVHPNGVCGGSMATTSVGNISNDEQDIVIYPNPATSELTISAQGQIKTVTISNIFGQTVYASDNNNSQSALVDVSVLPAGIYFVKVRGQVRKFVKE
jgi:hypothetical protein